jgi:CelD/BcsL family acetyltransferase involved in cellulose biosynthesis
VTIKLTLAPIRDFDALSKEWRALEEKAGDHGFFRSWSWVGCLADERFPNPVLLRARRGDRTIGLALLNRRRGWSGRLCLGESGDPVLDAPFVEHNGPLLARGEGAETLTAMAGAALRASGGRLVLGGVEPALLEAVEKAGGAMLRRQDREAPLVRLDAVRRDGGDYLAGLSANTRHQLRRSARRYAARGALVLDRAGSLAEALAWLDAMMTLHSAAWQARGQPGAFAHPFMRRFHRTLVERAFPRGEVELLRGSAGGQAFGYLYNFRLGGRILAYQSGFDYAAPPHAKPGLTCHHLAVERALAAGDRSYDFLAGADRYKQSLANASTLLAWAEMAPRLSVAALLGKARNAARRLLRRA